MPANMCHTSQNVVCAGVGGVREGKGVCEEGEAGWGWGVGGVE